MIKNRVIALCVAVMLVFSCLSVLQVGAASNSEYTYDTLEDNTIQITKYIGAETSVDIPSEIDGYTVSQIGQGSFKGCFNIKQVEIPDTVKNVCDYAFDDCTALTSINIPSSIKSIGNSAFFDCTRLKSVTFSENLESIGEGAFYNCSALESLSLPDSLNLVGEYVFGNCSKLKTAHIGTGLKTIGNLMFYSCPSLKSVNIPDGITDIGRKAFYSCAAISNITFPDSLISIGDNAFDMCSDLSDIKINCEKIGKRSFASLGEANITFSDRVKSIGNNAFENTETKVFTLSKNISELADLALYGINAQGFAVSQDNKYFCTQDDILYNSDKTQIIAYPSNKQENSSFTVPSGVKVIKNSAFSHSQLNKLILPDTLTTVEDNAFSASDNLQTVEMPNSVTYIGCSAFSDCASLNNITIPSSLKIIKDSTFSGCSVLDNITLSDSIEKIEGNAFSQCEELQSIDIPKNVSEISASSFGYGCGILIYDVDSQNAKYKSVDGVLYTKDGTLIAYPSGREETAYSINKATNSIGDNAFMYNNNITEVNVPSSVKSLGKNSVGYAFDFENGLNQKQDFAIIGTNNSQAYSYASENGIAFFTGTPKQNIKSVSLKCGKTASFSVSNTPNLYYTSSNTNVAKVDKNGKITAVAQGSTIIVANAETRNFLCKVTVSDGKKAQGNYLAGYNKISSGKTYDAFTKAYYEFNKGLPFTKTDTPNIYTYSTGEYVPIMAIQVGGNYLKKTISGYGEDYKQYKTISDNLTMELERYSANENLVLFSGTSDISKMTGKTSTVKDLISSIGNTYVDKGVVSTSLFQQKADGFGSGATHTMLEIYGTKKALKGAYIEKMSEYGSEFEYLLNRGLTYKVIDAGVRQVTLNDAFDYSETVTQRYIKLKILGDDEDETTAPTDATSGTKQPLTTSANTAKQATNNTQTTKNTSTNKPVKTGQTNTALPFACLGLLIVISGTALFIRKHN